MKSFHYISLLVALLSSVSLYAQSPAADSLSETQRSRKVSLSVEARADYQRTYVDRKLDAGSTGIRGNVANVILKGNFSPKFEFLYRQRLNGINIDRSFFESIDFLYLQYNPTSNLSLKLGKWIVFVGGWELEPAPIDVFQLGEFCYHLPAYSWGGTLTYSLPGDHDQLHLQVIESPFRKVYEGRHATKADMYAYGLIWTAQHDFFHPMWSVNFMEYAPKKFINYISLGNRFFVGDKVFVDLEFMHRAAMSGQRQFFFKDFSLFGQLAYHPAKEVKLYLKGSYDYNDSGSDADLALIDGTKLTRLGGGVEYTPKGYENIRFHLNGNYAFGRNPNPEAYVRPNQMMINAGVTWRIKVL